MSTENLEGRTIAEYHLLQRIGEGGTAIVYKAKGPDGETCAVKILKERLRLDETAVKRFLREAEFGSRVDHPAVARTYDYGKEEGIYYLGMEWIDGVPLSRHIKSTSRMPISTVVSVVEQMAAALEASHGVGIIHRDLKPDNIMFDPQTNNAKLLDFGIARDAQVEPAERLTRAGFFVGTLQYVAPEALSGELVGESADIYSLSKITFHMLTGTNPHAGSSPRELFQKLLQSEPTPLNQAVRGLKFPQALEDAIMKGLARKPEDRQPSVSDFAREVTAGSVSGDGAMAGGFFNKVKGLFDRA